MTAPWWIDALVALLLVTSGVFALAAAWGVLRLRNFYQRMHPPALAFVWAAWCVTLAAIVHFSAATGALALHSWIIIVLLSITTPVTAMLLARAALFRGREAGQRDLPPPLQPHGAPALLAPKEPH